MPALADGSRDRVQETMAPEQQLALALEYGDLLRASMAGNLRSYEFESASGQVHPPERGGSVWDAECRGLVWPAGVQRSACAGPKPGGSVVGSLPDLLRHAQPLPKGRELCCCSPGPGRGCRISPASVSC